jgi:uncharacterized protein (TIRG00374 family)
VDSLHAFWDATVAFWDGLTSVAFEALLLALLLHLTNLTLRTRAWRNILQAAYPDTPVRWRHVFGAYLAGVWLNSIVPARGGDVMKVYLVHRSVPGSTYPTIASSLLAETAFDALVGSTLMIWAYSTGNLPAVPDLRSIGAFEWTFFANHARWFFLALALVMIALGVFLTWIEHHVTQFWQRIEAGLTIVRTPKRYLRQVVLWQLAGWCCRITALYFFLVAFHIEATFENALLVAVAQSTSTLMPFTPGGAGAQQAVLVFMFRGVAPSSSVLSFSVGMQASITITNALAGGVAITAMLRRLPWKARVPTEGEAAAAKP